MSCGDWSVFVGVPPAPKPWVVSYSMWSVLLWIIKGSLQIPEGTLLSGTLPCKFEPCGPSWALILLTPTSVCSICGACQVLSQPPLPTVSSQECSRFSQESDVQLIWVIWVMIRYSLLSRSHSLTWMDGKGQLNARTQDVVDELADKDFCSCQDVWGKQSQILTLSIK